MMNIIDFFKEFEFIKRRRLRSLGGAKAQGGAARPPEKLRGVRPVRGAPPETASDHTLSNNSSRPELNQYKYS